MQKTKIAWATHSSNIVSGCSKPAALPPEGWSLLKDSLPAALRTNRLFTKWRQHGTSPECIRCYAESISHRYKFTNQPWLEDHAGENVRLHPDRMAEWAKLPVKPVDLPPSQRNRIFVCSMGDLFHDLVPDAYIAEAFAEMRRSPHIYMVLTKRIERASRSTGRWARNGWPENVWLGTSVGHPITKWRMEYLRNSPALVRFVSMEPLLESLTDAEADLLLGPLNLNWIHQIIVGGESGGGYRKMKPEWARELRDRAAAAGCAFFYKQDSAALPGRRPWLVEPNGRRLEYHQFPGELTPPRDVTIPELGADADRSALEVLA
jgi:protein gp37